MTPEAGVLEYEHRIAAPPDVVFSYFVDPEKYRLWQGFDAELDPRPGGLFRVKVTETAVVRGEYVLVDPPQQVVFTWGWEPQAGLQVLRDVTPGMSTVEVTLVPDGEDTIVRLRHAGLPTEEGRRIHGAGWVHYLSRLSVVVDGGDPGPDPLPAQLAATVGGGP